MGACTDVPLRNPLMDPLPDGAVPPTVAGIVYRLNGGLGVLLTSASVAPALMGGTNWLHAIAWVLCLGRQRICLRGGTV